MTHTILLRASVALIALAPATYAVGAARPMTEQDLVSVQRLGAATPSPDGRFVAYQLAQTDLAANKRRTDLYLLDTRTRNARPVMIASEAGQNENSPAFSADGAFLYYLSDKSGSQQVWRIALNGGALNGGTPQQVTNTQTDVDGFRVSPQGNQIALWMDTGMRCAADACPDKPADPNAGTGREYGHLFVRHWDTWYTPGQHNRVFVLDIADGKATGAGRAIMGKAGHGDAPSKPFGGAEEIAWSADGQSVFVTLRQAGPKEPLSTNLDIWHAPADASAEPVNLTASNEATDTLPTPSPDGKWLAYAAMARPGYEADRQVLMLRDLTTGTVRALTQNWDRSVAGIAWAPDSKSLLVNAQDTLDEPLFRVDATTGRVTRLTQAGSVSSFVPRKDGSIIATMNSLTNPDNLYVIPARGGRAQMLVNANPQLGTTIDTVRTARFSFAGANGDTVWGQVIKPTNATGKLPVMFLVHGGPQGSFGNSWSHRWNPMTMASRGYAVVTIDFHGSTGYGQAFTDAINKDWGGKPLQDLKLGLAAAGRFDPQVDTANACALGGSYGGYMMNWIAGQWNDGFKCIVNHSGVFDARAMAYETEELWFDEWENGGPWYSRTDAEKWNPVNYVTNWKTPMLIIHGEKDFRIPYTQSIAAFTAAQRQGIKSRLVIFPDENHWILKPKNSMQWYRNVFDWVGAHTGRNTDKP